MYQGCQGGQQRLNVKVTALSKEDNVHLAQAIVATHHAARLRPAAALVALHYRFAGELVDVEEVLGRAWGG